MFQRSRVLNSRVKHVVKIVRFKKDVAIIGAPFSGGQRKGGVEKGPQALRDYGLVTAIEGLGRKVTDYGDVNVVKYSSTDPEVITYNGYQVKNSNVCGQVSHDVADLVEKAINDDNIAVTIGGDHSVATGTIAGHQRARGNICVLWIDAHNDINTYKTSPTGNLHGMCLSFLIRGLPDARRIPGYEWTKPCLNPFDIVYIGLRDTDPGEYTITNELGILTFSMHEVDRYGISTVVERAVESVNPRLDRPMHVSYDIDSLDPLHSPSTGTAVYGGLSLREGLYIGEYVNKLGIPTKETNTEIEMYPVTAEGKISLLSALDIVEVNPSLGPTKSEAELTVSTAVRITEACLGKHRSGYVSKRAFEYIPPPDR